MSARTEEIEAARIEFVWDRDGFKAALEFAQRGMKIYRQCVLGRKNHPTLKFHYASLDTWRETFIRSYLVYKRFWLKNKGAV